MYDRNFWQDHIVDEETGEVLVEGTMQDAEHFNNMEEGIFEAHETGTFAVEMMGKMERKQKSLEGEIIQATLVNTQPYPFNDSETTIALTTPKTNKNYVVTPEVVSATGGGVGEFTIKDKMLNGFKISFSGGASSVVVNLYIKGGD